MEYHLYIMNYIHTDIISVYLIYWIKLQKRKGINDEKKTKIYKSDIFIKI